MDIESAAVGLLIALFSKPGSALLLAMAILAFAVAVMAVTWVREVRPLSRALVDRLHFVMRAAGAQPEPLRLFAQEYDAIDGAMMRSDPPAPDLQRAWLEFRQTFVRLEPEAVSASSRADQFFGGAGRAGRTMEWWANIFVAIGLLFTFLGIVAALSQATRAIGAGASADQMQAALAALLSIAAAKFWTSVAGILASLILRVVGRRWRDRLEGDEEELCEALDSCVQHISPQSVSLLQLEQLRRLVAALEGGRGGAPRLEGALHG